ncbi:MULTISPECIES: hypothetical protein [unclassified Haladaptatus]|uniref:hypothetical protein n=1 Tax=unclassified Haladaptatus TaxID=2622732 RepID=UPI00209C1702|nr:MULTISPECIES: hypothetical protein [unclassified Haladaptatus]MCO8243575.1 hypothetical protein [Haladaptatus sp. AB643]MCO8254984.1 hypothetical protein [Haladaptatus sp. AB618]
MVAISSNDSVRTANFPGFADRYGRGMTFWLYGVLRSVALVFVYFCVFEADGRWKRLSRPKFRPRRTN